MFFPPHIHKMYCVSSLLPHSAHSIGVTGAGQESSRPPKVDPVIALGAVQKAKRPPAPKTRCPHTAAAKHFAPAVELAARAVRQTAIDGPQKQPACFPEFYARQYITGSGKTRMKTHAKKHTRKRTPKHLEAHAKNTQAHTEPHECARNNAQKSRARQATSGEPRAVKNRKIGMPGPKAAAEFAKSTFSKITENAYFFVTGIHTSYCAFCGSGFR